MRTQHTKRLNGVFVMGTTGVLLFLTFVLPLNVANAQSRNTLECPAVIEETSLPEDSFIDSIETDDYTATIEYTTPGGATEVLTLQFIDWEAASWAIVHPYFSHGLLLGKLDEVSYSFASLEGKCLNEIVFTYEACLYSGGSGPWMVYWDRWSFLAKRCEDGGGGGGGDGCQCPPESPNGSISGTVTGFDGLPIAGRTVKAIRIRPKPKVKLSYVVTDADGRYRFCCLENGKYKVKVKGCKGGGRIRVKIRREAQVNGVDFQCK